MIPDPVHTGSLEKDYHEKWPVSINALLNQSNLKFLSERKRECVLRFGSRIEWQTLFERRLIRNPEKEKEIMS